MTSISATAHTSNSVIFSGKGKHANKGANELQLQKVPSTQNFHSSQVRSHVKVKTNKRKALPKANLLTSEEI